MQTIVYLEIFGTTKVPATMCVQSVSDLDCVLIVDDSDDDKLLLTRSLRKAGVKCRVDTLPDGEAAIEFLSGAGAYSDRLRHPLPILMLLDLKMPRKNGFEVLEWLREQPGLNRIPVIVLTGSREDSDLRRAYDLGANSYLVKPVDSEERSALANALSSYWLNFNERAPVLS